MPADPTNIDDDPDPNFLFGLLAINQGVIDGPTLADAFTEARSDKELSVADILERRGVITPSQRNSIRSLMDQYLHESHSDLQALLSSVLSNQESELTESEIGDDNKTVVSHEVDAGPISIDTLVSDSVGSPDGRNRSSRSLPPTMPVGERYRFVKELRRGGLGVVSVAVDSELNREVALKRIRPEKAFEEAYRSKFLREAEITGNLEHPGVVPVYGLGVDSLGHLFYAMQLIRGDTLSELIEKHWRTVVPGSAAFYHPRLVALLDHFLAVCQTISYAHKRGVLHRDLKPDNVMVGSYGETLVVDWGLAKVHGQPDPKMPDDPDGLGPPNISESVKATRFGVAMGTPAYASPELITGQILDVDERSDIYGLGAILFELLSGQAPVSGRTINELKGNAAIGKVTNLLSIRPNIPKSLAAICMTCLSMQQEDRYQSVAELIDDLQCWKADQPVSRVPENWYTKTARWFRHHRGYARSGIAAIVSAAIVAAAAGFILYQKNEVNATLSAQNAKLAETEAVLRKQAQSVRDLLVSTFRSPDPRLDGHAIKVSELLDRTVAHLDTSLSEDDPARGEMYLAIGQSYLGMGQPQEAVLLLRKATDAYRQQRGEKASETLRARRVLAEALRTAGLLGESQQMIRQTLADLMEDVLPDEAEVAAVQYQMAETNLQAGEIKMAEQQFRAIAAQSSLPPHQRLSAQEGQARVMLAQGKFRLASELFADIYRQRSELESPTSPDALKTRTSLAEALERVGEIDDASRIYREILQVQQEDLGDNHPETLVTRNNLAVCLRLQLKVIEATEMFESTHQQFVDRLGMRHPDTLVTANNLAESWETSGQSLDAAALLETTIDQMQQQVDSEHPDLLVAKHNLAIAYLTTGRSAEAIALHLETLEAREAKLGDEHPETLASRLALAQAFVASGQLKEARPLIESVVDHRSKSLGDEHVKTLEAKVVAATFASRSGKSDDALRDLDQLVPLLTKSLGSEHPTTLSAVNEQATVLLEASLSNEAIQLLKTTHERCQQRLGKTHPQTLATALNLAIAMRDSMQLIQSIPLLEETLIEIRDSFSGDHPLALTTMNHLALAYESAQWNDQALSMLRESVDRHQQKLGVEHPQTATTMKRLADMLFASGETDESGRIFSAVASAQRKNLDPNDPRLLDTLVRLGRIQQTKGEFEAAVKTLETVQDAVGDDEQHHGDLRHIVNDELAMAYQSVGELGKAISLLRQNARLDEMARYRLALVLNDDQQYEEATQLLKSHDDALKQADAPEEDRFEVLLQLGIAYRKLGQFVQSETVLREAEGISASIYAETWLSAWAKAVLADTLMAIDKRADAKRLYAESYEILKTQSQNIPPALKSLPKSVDDSLEALADDESSDANENRE